MKRIILAALAILTFTSNAAFAAKLADDTVLDASLNIIKNGATTLVFCSSVPANYAGVAAVTLMSDAGAAYTGPVDDTSGRKLTVGAIGSMPATATGTVNAVCLTNGTSILYGCTYAGGSTNGTSGGTAVTSGNIYSSGAFKINIQDPT